jgi:hypothetical protein
MAGGDDTAAERRANQLFGSTEVARLTQLDPNGWYPIQWLLDLMELLDAKLGRFALIKMGRTLFQLTHEERARATVKSGWDIIHGFDSMYHHANRGTGIGGWRVISFETDRAEMEKTTPHHCAMEEGILAQALQAVGAPAVVSQTQCFREGADACRFLILPSAGGRWRP